MTTINSQGYYSTENKVKIPQKIAIDPPIVLPKHKLFSEKEANTKINKINNDIYIESKKEKKRHEFNKPLFFKIFGTVTLSAIAIACFSKIRNFFR